MSRTVRSPAFRSSWLKLLSLSLAIILWLFVARQELAEMEFGAVPVAFGKLPPNMEMISRNTSSVSVRLRGPRGLLATIDANKIRAKADDFPQEVSEGRVVLSVRSNSVSTFPGVDVIDVDPAQIRVTLERKAAKDVDVQPAFKDRPPAGYEFREYQVNPPTVRVEAPRSILENLDFMSTEAIDLSGSTRTFVERVSLSIDKPNVKLLDVDRVGINIRIEQRIVDRQLRTKIRLEPPSAAARVQPVEAVLVLRGPELVLRDLYSGTVSVVAILDATYPGVHVTPLVVTDLPQGCSVLYLLPEQVSVTIPSSSPPSTAMGTVTAGDSTVFSQEPLADAVPGTIKGGGP